MLKRLASIDQLYPLTVSKQTATVVQTDLFFNLKRE